ncbi:MAG: AMP-binding protein [Bacteroidota bacterium]
MEETFKDIHRSFKLNGYHIPKEALREVGYSLIKEGSSYERSIGDFLLDWLDEKPTVQVMTSGSTGTPRLIHLKKEHMINSALATGKFFALEPKDTALLCLPADYIAGKMMLVRAMVLGLALDYVEPSSNPLGLTTNTYDFCAMVPLQLQNSIKHLKRINTLIVGGAPVSRNVRAQIPESQTRIFETYGMTETVTHIAAKRLSRDDKTSNQNNHNTSFSALPGVAFSIDRRDCLTIKAPKVSETQIVTNDIVVLISHTEFKWLGRYDNIINSGGIKLVPEQVEAKLSSLLDTRFFIAGLPDPDLGQKAVLVIEGETDREQLKQRMASSHSLDKFEIPRAIYTVPRFAETRTGKIHRKKTLDSLTV